MKPFNLEEYLANPSRKIVTREGRDVRIICTDKCGGHPIVALVRYDDAESLVCYDMNGRMWGSTEDIFFAPEKHEGWVNIYLDADNSSYVGTCIYKSKEEAEESGKKWSCYITTLKIEWEE